MRRCGTRGCGARGIGTPRAAAAGGFRCPHLPAEALTRRQIRGAALDVLVEEPLLAASPLWAMEHVLITPHTAGETCRYEDDVLAIMQENLARLWRGETELLNQVV